MRRYTVLHERWEEEKLRRRAESLLGLGVSDEDAPVYTRSELEEFQRDWERP